MKNKKIICSAVYLIFLLLLSLSAYSKSCLSTLRLPFVVNNGLMDKDVLAYVQTFAGRVIVNHSGQIDYRLNDLQYSELFPKSKKVQIELDNPTKTKINYFIGSDKSFWNNDISSFNTIIFEELYDGISLELKAIRNNIEKVFYIDSGSNPNQILISVEDVSSLTINNSGELLLDNKITYTRPYAFQIINGHKIEVEVSYDIIGNSYGFVLGEYDLNHQLIIDPLLSSTYLGGSGKEGGDQLWSYDIAIGSDNNIYVAGVTLSSDFPAITGAYGESNYGNDDVFIAKFDNNLGELIAATYLGGVSKEEFRTMLIDDAGNVYLSGSTYSSDFPTTAGCYDDTKTGDKDAFIAVLSPDLATLQRSTFLGGTGDESRPMIAFGPTGDLYITGEVTTGNFPTTTGAYDTDFNGGVEPYAYDYFISRLDNDLTTLIASTYLGGIYNEIFPCLAIDDINGVYVTGATGSYDFPSTSVAYDPDFNGPHSYDFSNLDAFVAKFDYDLTTIVSSTFFGGTSYDGGGKICIDNSGNIVISGHTLSSETPTTTGTIDTEYSGNEYYISVFDNNLTGLIRSTFLTPDDAGIGHIFSITLSGSGEFILSGKTSETNFPTTIGAYDRVYNGGDNDAFLMKISEDLSEIKYSSFYGGSGDELIVDVTLDQYNIYAIGYTTGSDLPSPTESYDSDYNGGMSDCFVAKFTFEQFTEVTEGPHVNNSTRSSGVCWIDYNDDNYLDIYETNSMYPADENNCLYENQGDGTYAQVNNLAIVNDENFSTGAIWADYDNDNDLDLFVAAHRTDPNQFYVNNGDGSFTHDLSVPMDDEIVGSTTSSWIDYNNDGYLDLFIGNSTYGSWGYPPYRNFLYKNNLGAFTEIIDGDIVTLEKHTYGASWCDYDNDGDMDLIEPGNIENDEYVSFYRNEGDETFTLLSSSIICQTSGLGGASSWADYDNDGDMDLFIAGYSPGPALLYQNNGDGSFSGYEDSEFGLLLDRPVNGSWVDYDNDGDIDILLLSNIYEFGVTDSDSSLGILYNNDNGVFTKMPDTLIFSDSSLIGAIVWGDSDRDGDLDLYVPMFKLNQTGATNLFFKNNGNENNWITVKCIGSISNKSAIGTKVRLRANINGTPVWQMREITSQTEACTQPPMEAHFGLGDATLIDSIKVGWPGGQITDIITNVAANQLLTITESLCGDIDETPGVNILDVVYIINYKYKSGPEPVPYYAADVNSDEDISILDVVYLINYKYKNGPAPDCP